MQQTVTAMDFSGLPGWRLRFGQTQLDICQQGAQILSYFADIEQPPLIWLRTVQSICAGKACAVVCRCAGLGLAIFSVTR